MTVSVFLVQKKMFLKNMFSSTNTIIRFYCSVLFACFITFNTLNSIKEITIYIFDNLLVNK